MLYIVHGKRKVLSYILGRLQKNKKKYYEVEKEERQAGKEAYFININHRQQ